jgi:hypothetical protein
MRSVKVSTSPKPLNGVRCGDEIKRFFHVFLDIPDRMVFDALAPHK